MFLSRESLNAEIVFAYSYCLLSCSVNFLIVSNRIDSTYRERLHSFMIKHGFALINNLAEDNKSGSVYSHTYYEIITE